jgi:hypothetical protein
MTLRAKGQRRSGLESLPIILPPGVGVATSALRGALSSPFSPRYCKTSEWAHEQEHRLLLWSSMHNFQDEASRKLRYNFADLSGIIFGIKTAAEAKRKIMRIIAEKCKAESRIDFEFHQMQYSCRDRSFRIAPLKLIRF